MKMSRSVNNRGLLACVISALVAMGCQKTPEPKTATAAMQSGGASVALPPDQMPPPDSAIAPKAAGASDSGASVPTQANPAPLNKTQEQAGMPNPGQVNNHSVPQSTGTGQ